VNDIQKENLEIFQNKYQLIKNEKNNSIGFSEYRTIICRSGSKPLISERSD
jgi:hypothetical protein